VSRYKKGDKINMGKYDWRQWTRLSDSNYRRVKESSVRNFEDLRDHNLVINSQDELRTIIDIAERKWGVIQRGTAIDVCCGAGFVTAGISDFGFSVTGIDINKDAIELAQETHRDCMFVAGDATNPFEYFRDSVFDFILIREAHPFSRIDDFDFQIKVLMQYFSLLKPGGVMVLAHARRGGGMFFPSVDFGRVKKALLPFGGDAAGPLFLSLIKKWNIRTNFLFLTCISVATSVIGRLTGKRLIESFFIHKPR
jgi:SAM-dependent methyltransferase